MYVGAAICMFLLRAWKIGQLEQQTYNMEQASLTTDNLRNTMATVDAMKIANKEMKKQYGKLDVDKIEVSFEESRDDWERD